MGYEVKTIEIAGRVSRHNSDADVEDDLLWAEVQRRVREIEDDPRYGGLILVTSGAEAEHVAGCDGTLEHYHRDDGTLTCACGAAAAA